MGSGRIFPFGDLGQGLGRVALDGTANVVDGDVFAPAGTGEEGNEPSSFIGLAVSERRIGVFFFLLFFALAAIAARAFDMQIARGDAYREQAEENRRRVAWVPSERGIMVDRDGRTLVRNVANLAASILPADLPKEPAERRRLIGRLAEILDVPPIDIERKLDEFKAYPSRPVAVGERLSHTQAVLVSIESARSGAVRLDIGTRREYAVDADSLSLSHLIGYEGRVTEADISAGADPSYGPSDLVGKAGLERSYEGLLRGTFARRTVEVDARGREKRVIADDAGAPGRSLVLTIDTDLQKTVERILKERLRMERKRRGSVIVMDPKTGDVLAMVSVPAFDNNAFAAGISGDEYRVLLEDPDKPMFPRAVSASLPAGSTFKLAVGAAAIEEGLVTPRTSILSTGGIRVGRWYFPDWKSGGHGRTDIVKAIAESVNTYFYVIGGGLEDAPGLGAERIVAHARRFGFGEPLGIDLPGEGAGFMPSKAWKERVKKEPWYIGDTYHMAIGQGDVLVTPLQIASMTAVFASGGALVKPRLVGATFAQDGTRAERPPEVVNGRVVGPEAIDAVRRGMRAAVTLGSARSLADLPVAVAAKTGTAQWSSKHPPHAWFTSFAPYDDPEIVVTVVIEEGGEGSQVAAPVARRIYESYFARGIP